LVEFVDQLVSGRRWLEPRASSRDKKAVIRMMNEQAQGRRAEIVLGLFELYYDRVFAFARKSAEQAVAEDETQEAFMRLLQHPRLEDLEISISYLLKIVHNILRRRHTRSVRLREILDEEVTPRERRRHDDSLGLIFDRKDADSTADLGSLDRAFGRLADDERDAIRLIVCEGRSYSEAARSLGVSVTTINNWKHRGLGKLRKYLAAERIIGDALPFSRHAQTA
jgi:RNA polymerase sigma factor (sigma-70 family)